MGGKSSPAPYKPPEPVVDDTARTTAPDTSAVAANTAAEEEKKNQGRSTLGSTGSQTETRRRSRDPGSAVNASGPSLAASSVLTG